MTVSKETYFEVMECYGYRCCSCFSNEWIELHRRLPNYERYRRKFKLFLHSPMNLIPLCKSCHIAKSKYSITEREAEMFERFLAALKEQK